MVCCEMMPQNRLCPTSSLRTSPGKKPRAASSRSPVKAVRAKMGRLSREIMRSAFHWYTLSCFRCRQQARCDVLERLTRWVGGEAHLWSCMNSSIPKPRLAQAPGMQRRGS